MDSEIDSNQIMTLEGNDASPSWKTTRPTAAWCRVFVNLETTEKVYKGGEQMCYMDGFVCFHNSELVSGRLGKATLGGGNKSSLFQVLFCAYEGSKFRHTSHFEGVKNLHTGTCLATYVPRGRQSCAREFAADGLQSQGLCSRANVVQNSFWCCLQLIHFRCVKI